MVELEKQAIEHRYNAIEASLPAPNLQNTADEVANNESVFLHTVGPWPVLLFSATSGSVRQLAMTLSSPLAVSQMQARTPVAHTTSLPL